MQRKWKLKSSFRINNQWTSYAMHGNIDLKIKYILMSKNVLTVLLTRSVYCILPNFHYSKTRNLPKMVL